MITSDILCFGGEDWWYHNRGHIDMQLMRRFARDRKVLYINSLVMQKARIGAGSGFWKKCQRKAKSIFRGIRKTDAGFWVYSPASMPVHHLKLAGLINHALLKLQIQIAIRKLGLSEPIIWVACPVAYRLAAELNSHYLVYQRTDRYEEFPNVDRKMIKDFDLKLKAMADLTVYANEALCIEEQGQCRRALFLDHGVDYDLFAGAEQSEYKPEDIKNIRKPVIGFYGGIDNHTFDIRFAEEVVSRMPEYSFVFVGKASVDCSGLLKLPNVTMVGQKSYEEIPHYGKYFDVAIMPWNRNRWIEVCNPIKLKEYLALGKPIVSTPFSELDKYNGCVYRAGEPGEFAAMIKKALEEDCIELKIKRRKLVERSTWQSKADMVLQNLQ